MHWSRVSILTLLTINFFLLTETVLLRILEYYDGILILTTNRIRTFDIAVQSRINLAIRYNELSNDQKKKIYLNFIEQLNEENTEDKEQLRDFVIKDEDEPPFMTLNGRQIRNVLFSAASLAKAESDHRLRQKHIDGVLTETKKFQRDIQVMIDMARQEAEIGRT